jgi:TrmH family RNA methyltransferase
MKRDWRGVLADIERAATAAGRLAVGRFSIEGTRLHERALTSRTPPESALVAGSYRRSESDRLQRLCEQLEAAGCRLYEVPDAVISTLTEGRRNGAIVGLVPLPRAPRLGQVVAADQRPALLLVAVDVEDPGNVGALVRTALASGASVFVGVGLGDPFHPKAVRTSMGSLFRLPLLRYPRLGPLLDELRELGVATVGAVSSGGASLPCLQLKAPAVALCVGNEATGLQGSTRSALDALVTIPMGSAIDSYSVNAAAAILLYELGRSRRAD